MPRFLRAATATLVAVMATVIALSPGSYLNAAGAQAFAFLETFSGAPKSPTPYHSYVYDFTVIAGGANSIRPMMAHHGSDCSGFPSTHVVARVEDAVFQCNNHIMTAINDGYGAVYFSPNAMLDFSHGPATLKWDMSTFRTSGRDWIDVFVMPLDDNLQLSFYQEIYHLPINALHLDMNAGPDLFITSLWQNGVKSDVGGDGYHTWDMVFADHGLAQSATRRDTFQLDLSTTHVKFGMPGYNFNWVDNDIPPLNFNKGIVQFIHRSYNPEKGCNFAGTCGPDTWHWSNISLNPATPFTIIAANERTVGEQTGNKVTFPAPAPAGAHLRFAGGPAELEVSLDNGATWQAAPHQGDTQGIQHPEIPDNYWMPVPQGTQSALLRGVSRGNVPWYAIGLALWAPGAEPSFAAPAAAPTAPPAPFIRQSVTFDAHAQGRLEDDYPSRVIDWGSSDWSVSAPVGSFSTNNLHFDNDERPDATFAFVGPRRLVQLDAHNTGSSTSTIRLICDSQPVVTTSVPAGQTVTIQTDWNATCSGIQIGSSNSGLTHFNNLMIDGGTGAVSSSTVVPPTRTPVPTSTTVPPTSTPVATRTSTPALAPGGPTAVTFNTLGNPNRVLSGQYPSGLIDWGTTAWWLAGPYAPFPANSVSFSGAGPSSASIGLVGAHQLVSIDVGNGGTAPSLVSLSCAGQPTVQVTAAPQQVVTLRTGWTGTCANATISSSNGWDTNFNNFIVQ